MLYQHVIQRRIEFHETDLAGIVHFSRFFNYMEAAEHEMFRELGYSIVTRIEGKRYAWPRVHAECDYRRPLRFEDVFEVKLFVRQVRTKSIVYDFAFSRLEGGEPAERVARGSMAAACVAEEPDGTMHTAPIPAALREKLAEAPAELLPRHG